MTIALRSNRHPRGTWRLRCAVVTLFLAGNALAETSGARTFGDPALRAGVDTQVKRIYELTNGPGTQVELLTRDNPLEFESALGTELTAAMIDGSPGRIVGTVWTSRGKYSIEFYRDGDRLLMVYETFSFFAESAPADAWRNFMGLPAWESRIYFNARGEVGYAETHGRQAPAPEIAGKRLYEQARRVVEVLNRSPARWERR